MIEERLAAYETARDAYDQMVRKMSTLRHNLANARWENLPSAEQQHQHILQIARFLVEATGGESA